MIDVRLLDPRELEQPAPGWGYDPIDRDPYAFDVYEYAERVIADHYGIPALVAREALTDLDFQHEDETGVQYFERHLIDPKCWPAVAEALVTHIQETTGFNYALAAPPFTVTIH